MENIRQMQQWTHKANLESLPLAETLCFMSLRSGERGRVSMTALKVVRKHWDGHHTYVRVRAFGVIPYIVEGAIYKKGKPVSAWYPLYPVPNKKRLFDNNLPGQGRVKLRARYYVEVNA
jgi:hypothetical protein